jgi:hypothetical protein|tara:strand:+ start:447 stop:1427 length:981 start_codon:yes stop_codon:yes gene_type:complete
MELLATFQSTIIYVLVAMMSSFNITPEIKVTAVDATTRAVVMALRSSQVPVTYEAVEGNPRKDTISINKINLRVPVPDGCGSITADGRKDPKTLFYEDLPCELKVSIGDITIQGLELDGKSKETVAIYVNNVAIDLSIFSSGEMLAIKRMLQLEDELAIEQVGIGLGYDVASDQITAEFGFAVEGFGSAKGLIKLSSIRQDKSLYDEITGQLDRFELVITDEGMIETASIFLSISNDSEGIKFDDLLSGLFLANPLSDTELGDLSQVYPNSNENISELTKFMGGGMTVSCLRENPHQVVFDDDLFDLGPTMIFNMFCEKVTTAKNR